MGAGVSSALKALDFHDPVKLHEAQAKALWNRYDVDNDEKLDHAEIRSLCYDWCTANGIRKTGMDEASLLKLNRMVQTVVDEFLLVFDQDKDGFVTKEEFFGRLRNHEVLHDDTTVHDGDHHRRIKSVAETVKSIGEPSTHKSPNATAAYLHDVRERPLAHRAVYGGGLSHAQTLDVPADAQAHTTEPHSDAPEVRRSQTDITLIQSPHHLHNTRHHSPSLAEADHKHHAAVKSVAEREAELTVREQKLASQREEFAVLERKLEEYALQVARREAAVAEKEAQLGIQSQAVGVTAAVFTAKENEEVKLKRELIRRKSARLLDDEHVTVDAAKEHHLHKEKEQEEANESADKMSFGLSNLAR